MPIQQLKVWAAKKGIGESHWTLEELGLYEEKGTTGKKGNRIRESIFTITSNLGIRCKREQAKQNGKLDQTMYEFNPHLAGQRRFLDGKRILVRIM
jgi:hypothetical protein